MHGTADPWFPYSHAEKLADLIPGAKLIPIEGEGHAMPRAMYNPHVDKIVEHLRGAQADADNRPESKYEIAAGSVRSIEADGEQVKIAWTAPDSVKRFSYLSFLKPPQPRGVCVRTIESLAHHISQHLGIRP